MDVLKPFLMLACVAFVTGFVGFLAVVQLSAPRDEPAQSWTSTVSEPATSTTPNYSKLI